MYATVLSVDCPDDVQLKMCDDLLPRDICSVSLTDKVNNNRFYRLGLKPHNKRSFHLELGPGLLPSLIDVFQPHVRPFIHLVAQNPKEIALAFPSSMHDHLLTCTRKGKEFLALHKINNPLSIHRLETKISTVEIEIEKRKVAEEIVDRFFESQGAEYIGGGESAGLGPLIQYRKLLIRLIVNEMLTESQLYCFSENSYLHLFRSALGWERAIIHGLITAKEVVSHHNEEISSEVVQDAIINNQITREVGLKLEWTVQLALIEERLQSDINSGRPREKAIEFAQRNLPKQVFFYCCEHYFKPLKVEITNDTVCSLLFDLNPEALKNAKNREPLTGQDLLHRAGKFTEKLDEFKLMKQDL
jgi:hypothetical protein